MIPSTKVNHMIISTVQTILTPYHDPISSPPTLVDLVHIIQIQI
jgi:hypothetical protein